MVKEFAPGIPLPKTKEVIPEVTKPEKWKIGIQEHKTKRGKYTRVHHDLRINPPGTTKAYSWAIPKSRLPIGKDRFLAVEQPTHTSDYMPFEGRIPSGYGAGMVKLKKFDDTEIVRATKDKIVFNLYDGKTPQEYAMVRTKDNNWVLLNRTLTKKSKKVKIPVDRSKYKSISPEDINLKDPKFKDWVAMPKLDGGFATVAITDKEIRAFSHRSPKNDSSKYIEYTHKIPGFLGTRPPKELKGTVLQAEIMARKGRRIAEPQEVGGLLNSNVWKSRERQKELGKLEPHIFNITRYAGKDVAGLPYSERRKLIKEVVHKIKPLRSIDTTSDPGKKVKLLQAIKQGKHPLTREGIVLANPNKNEFIKVKLRPDYDVYIREFYPGEGKYKGVGVGGYRYSFTARGPIVGHVGTGLSDELRRDMLKNPQKYLNKVARVQAQSFTDKKGKITTLRAPSHIDIHWEKSM